MGLSLTCKDLRVSANLDARLAVEDAGEGHARIRADWDAANGKEPTLEIAWSLPLLDIQYEWFPTCGANRSLRVDWQEPVISKLSSSAPVYCFYNNAGRNRFTVALSDARTELGCAMGVREEDGTLRCLVRVPLNAACHSYEVTLYWDLEDVSFAQALARVARWWARDCGMPPIEAPETARLPMYSTWYGFHQATVDTEIEAEAARAAKLGMRAVIVDDGWQTEDGQRGYGYCGDWRPTPRKIRDMRAHVAAIHALGMKYLLWYSVPFIGEWSEHWQAFSGMLLDRNAELHMGVLDPRYPEARRYLIGTYEAALRDWDLDGFKLDFIDSFHAPDGEQPPAQTPQMDYARVEDAVLRLMTDVMRALRRVKPDVLIEFRQSYIGPAMQTFGNMFRAGDCPADYLSNRVSVADIRLLSGGGCAVHSDMLMWHGDDAVENATRQLLNVLFAVPQISVRLDRLPKQHLDMLAFWLDFMTRHRELLAAPLEVESPQQLYPLLRARLGAEEAVAVYEIRHAAKLSDAGTTYLFNATAEEDMIVTVDTPRALRARLYDCMGRDVGEADTAPGTLHRLRVPVSGFAVIG